MMNNRLFKILMTVVMLIQMQSVRPATSKDATITIPSEKKITSMTVQFGEKGKYPSMEGSVLEDGLNSINKALARGQVLHYTLSSEPSYVKYSIVDSDGKSVHHDIIENTSKDVLNDFTTTRPQHTGSTIKYQLDKNKKEYRSPFVRESNTLHIVPGKK